MSVSSQLALGNSYLVAASSHGIVSVWEKVSWTNAISWRMAILSQSHLNGCKWWDEGNFPRKTSFAGELAPSLQRPVSSGFLPSGQCWSGLSVKNAIIAFIIFHNLFGQGFFFRCLFRHWVISRRSNLGVGGDLLVIDHPLSLTPPSLLRVGRTLRSRVREQVETMIHFHPLLYQDHVHVESIVSEMQRFEEVEFRDSARESILNTRC